LGEGAFGRVVKCISNFDRKYYALKLIQSTKGKIDFNEIFTV